MEKLFGIPVDILMWAFAGLTLLVVALSVFVTIRQPVLFRLSLRNIPRRAGRSALIVLGLMLATTIISAAFGTGDTISKTVRTEVITELGNIDELVSSQEEGDIEVTGESAQLPYFDEQSFEDLRAATVGNTDIDGVIPVLWEGTGIQNLTTRQTEPRVTVFAPDPRYMDGFGVIHNVAGGAVSVADLNAGEVFINSQAAEDLLAQPGHQLTLYGPSGATTVSVKAVVRYDGGGTISTEPGLIMPLAQAQAVFEKQGQIQHIAISNRGGAESGASLSDKVITSLNPTLQTLGLAIEATKRDDLKEADDAGSAMSSFFVTFGSFSIAAGIMLIFLIFVMLAEERKTEMGISRAIGTERRHLIEMFAFEGLAYDLFAAAVGALLGVAIAYAMATIIGNTLSDLGVELRRTMTLRSLVTAYCMGVVLTFIVVTISAWRVSLLNIVTAIRNLPEPSKQPGRASLIWGIVLLGIGLLLTYAGLDAKQVTPFSLGVSLIIMATVPILRWRRVPDRVAYTLPAVILLTWWLLPFGTFDFLLPEMGADFNWFITGGLIMVIAATWILIYNSDKLVNVTAAPLSRIHGLAPILKTAVSYPLTNRFRTGVTLAMFTMVVFTLVVGAVTTNAFTKASDDVERYGGGFDIRADTVRVNPIPDMRASISSSSDLNAEQFDVIGDRSLVAVEVKQAGTDNEFADYPLRGLDGSFLQNTTYRMAAIANGFDSPRAVWKAVENTRGLAVMDALPAPRRDKFVGIGGPQTDFRTEGFFIEDGAFDPFQVEVRDPVTGNETTLTVVGILTDTAPQFMIGLSTSQRTVQEAFPEQAAPNSHLIRLAPGTDAGKIADSLESEFLQNGLEATVLEEELGDALAFSRAFNYIVEGFLGLGLIVGVAALGVISARSVVERRQEIGVMRAIGFEKGRVQISFLLESCMVAIVGIVVGTVLALVTAFNIISDTQKQPGWENLAFSVPWLVLAIIFAIVLVAALITTFVPARRASNVYPAEALRYE